MFGDKHPDSLQHFMRHSPEAYLNMPKSSQRNLAQAVGTECLLLLDDTGDARQGKKIDGLGIHHSGNGLVKGLCAVTAVIKSADRIFAWSIRTYYSKKCCPTTEFRSKVQLAAEIIQEARKTLLGSVTVLMDSWYCCAPILNLIIQSQWNFVAAIKQNSKILVNGPLTYVCHLAKGPRQYTSVHLSKKRRLKVVRAIIVLPKVGTVVLLIGKHPRQSRSFISNRLDASVKELIELYRQRFEIELFHKDIKQHLGFGEMFVRSHHCVQKHWTLVIIAYNAIALSDIQSHCFRRKAHKFRSQMCRNSLKRLAKIKSQT